MKQDSFISRHNLDYIESLFQDYREKPQQVAPEWKMFFSGVELARFIPAFSEKEMAVLNLIHSYREEGHRFARLDPLKLKAKKNLSPASFGLTEQNLNQTFQVGRILNLKKEATLRDIITFLEKSYCRTLSLQAEGVPKEIKKWLFNEFENKPFTLSEDQKKNIFYELARTEALEKFLHSRFPGAKRFSIEGGDALIPMLEYLAEQAVQQEVKELVIGMAHRGRLNVLNNFMNQGTEVTLMEFDGGKALKNFDFEGDVKYHAGYSSVKKFPDGSACNVLLAYNPSHLEAVNPVVCGIARARQRALNQTGTGQAEPAPRGLPFEKGAVFDVFPSYRKDKKHEIHALGLDRGSNKISIKDQEKRKAVLPVLIHGDSAFTGQGVVSETLQLSQLKGWTTGGAFHIILNNQVGFTTDPKDARSSLYAGDLARSIQAPVLLVNADDLTACMKAVDIALRYRQKFGQDIFIDLICYRRFGHNEGDEPAFTQPVMYQKIKAHPTARRIFSALMEKEKLISRKEGEVFYEQQLETLQGLLDKTRKQGKVLTKKDLKGVLWAPYKKTEESDFFKACDTCPVDSHLEKVLKALTEPPEGFHLHPKVKKLIETRKQKVRDDKLDWALCELSAYGTLCLENHPVRLTGQDSKRGTFSHRHAVYFDTETDREFTALSHLHPEQGEFCIYNSPLSEMAVLGFEYGNASTDHSFFTVWEAQFGDFANGAQIIIDQFISSGEEKWMQSSGLVLLLPHGYEGQGPEHSSARLERFLQLSAQGNIQVCQPTTPANFFHLLRRQMKRDFRKPLIVMTPKSLLRHPEVTSSKKDLLRTKGFQEVLSEPLRPTPKEIQTLILLSGKIYFDLQKEKRKKPELFKQSLFVRIEQFYPFPQLALTPFLNGYSHLKKVIWIQEEPANMGALSFIKPRLRDFMDEIGLSHIPIKFLSREEKASPATGSFEIHRKEYQNLIKSLFMEMRKSV